MEQTDSAGSERAIRRVPENLLTKAIQHDLMDTKTDTQLRDRSTNTIPRALFVEEDSIGRRLSQRKAAESLLLLKKKSPFPPSYISKKNIFARNPLYRVQPSKSPHSQIIENKDPILNQVLLYIQLFMLKSFISPRQQQTVRQDLQSIQTLSDSEKTFVNDLYSKYTKLLFPGPRKWMYYEFFYSTYDRQFFLYNDFNELLIEMNIRKMKMTRKEWNILRRRMGTVRRFSAAFLEEGRNQLHQFREALLQAQQEQRESMFEFNNVHYAIPISYVIGQTVYALHPVHKYIAKGLIVSLQPQTHTVFVYFDDVDDSIHQLSVTDLATDGLPVFMNSPHCTSPLPSEVSSTFIRHLSLSDITFLSTFNMLLQRKSFLLKELSWASTNELSSLPPTDLSAYLMTVLQSTDQQLDFYKPLLYLFHQIHLNDPQPIKLPQVLSSIESYIESVSIQTHHFTPESLRTLSTEPNKQFSILLSNTVILVTILTITKMAIENLIPKPVATSLITQLKSKILCYHSENQSLYESTLSLIDSILLFATNPTNTDSI